MQEKEEDPFRSTLVYIISIGDEARMAGTMDALEAAGLPSQNWRWHVSAPEKVGWHGCLHAHQDVCRQAMALLQNDDDFVIIVEDNIAKTPRTKTNMDKARQSFLKLQEKKEEWTHILLGFNPFCTRGGERTSIEGVFVKHPRGCMSTHCQIVKRSWMRALLEAEPVWARPVDFFHFGRQLVFVPIVFPRSRTLPSLATPPMQSIRKFFYTSAMLCVGQMSLWLGAQAHVPVVVVWAFVILLALVFLLGLFLALRSCLRLKNRPKSPL